LSWDDYDTAGPDPGPGSQTSLAEHIGRPLTAVPDPAAGNRTGSEHFKEPLRESLAKMGVWSPRCHDPDVSLQGAYTGQMVIPSMRRRATSGGVAKYRPGGTLGPARSPTKTIAERGHRAYYPFPGVTAPSAGATTHTVTGFRRPEDHRDPTSPRRQVGTVPIAEVAGKRCPGRSTGDAMGYERG